MGIVGRSGTGTAGIGGCAVVGRGYLVGAIGFGGGDEARVREEPGGRVGRGDAERGHEL